MPTIQVASSISEVSKEAENPALVTTESVTGVFLWRLADPLLTATPRAPHPYALRETSIRLGHVAKRLLERTGIDLTIPELSAIEEKIRWCQTRRELQRPYAPILPRCRCTQKTRLTFIQQWMVRILSRQICFIVDRPTMRVISVWRGHRTPPP